MRLIYTTSPLKSFLHTDETFQYTTNDVSDKSMVSVADSLFKGYPQDSIVVLLDGSYKKIIKNVELYNLIAKMKSPEAYGVYYDHACNACVCCYDHDRVDVTIMGSTLLYVKRMQEITEKYGDDLVKKIDQKVGFFLNSIIPIVFIKDATQKEIDDYLKYENLKGE